MLRVPQLDPPQPTDEDSFCFVHAADLHLGARRWVKSLPQHPVMRRQVTHADTFALRSLLDLCVERKARFLFCAGDIIDGWCRDYMVALRFAEELLRLRDADCQVLLLLGNHDVRSRMLKSVPLPHFASILGLHGPETWLHPQLPVAVHAWSAPDVKAGTDAAALYPPPIPNHLNIGLLHTSADGRQGHVDYAPSSRLTLRRHGYDYWALGHVHQREVIAQKPWIVFPGNLQARGSRERGAKGASLVRVAAGRIQSVEHVAVDALRFETLCVDTSGVEDPLPLLALVSATLRDYQPARPTVLRLELRGLNGASCLMGIPPARREREMRRAITAGSAPHVWVDEVIINTDTDLGSWPLVAAA